MKRKVLFTLFLLLPMLAVMATENSWRYAKEPVLILKKDSVIEDISSNEKMFSKGDRFLFGRKGSDGSEIGFGVDLWDPLTIEIYFRDSNGIAYSSNINDVYLEDNNLKIDTDIKNSHWIPSYYYALLESQNVKNKLLEYESHWNNFENFTADPDLTWFDCFTVQRFYFDDFYFVYFGKYDYYNDVDFLAYLAEVSDTKIVYDVQKMYSRFSDYYSESPLFNHPDFIPLYEKETPFKVILTLDGDYMKMYIDEVSEENLFQILVRTTPEACDQIEKWIKGDSDDLSKVVMPRSSSVQKESSPAAPAANISPDKIVTKPFGYKTVKTQEIPVEAGGIYRVYENLKLRENGDINGSFITTMHAGTLVKVISLGQKETIDGIKSNWVEIEVQLGGRDKDGKPIKAGKRGWCFGGYLEIGEYEGSELFVPLRIKIIRFLDKYLILISSITAAVLFIYNVVKIIKSIRARKKDPENNIPVSSLILICAGCILIFWTLCDCILPISDFIFLPGFFASTLIYISAGVVAIVREKWKKKEAPGGLSLVITGEIVIFAGLLIFLLYFMIEQDSIPNYEAVILIIGIAVVSVGNILVTEGVLGPKVNKKEKIQE